MTLSIRARLAAAYALAIIVALSVTSVAVLWQQERIGIRRVDRELDTLASTLANGVRDELHERSNPAHAAREVQTLIPSTSHSFAILDADGTVLAARWNGLELPGRGAELPAVSTVSTPRGVWRVRSLREGSGEDGVTLLVAAPLADVQREQREAREAMLVGIPIVFLLAAGGGIYLSSLSVRPVAKALVSQRQFTADAAHELRTPVSVIRATADVMLSREHRDESEYREALGIVRGQARGLGRLVQDMLVLARADAGAYLLRPVDLYFDELVMDCSRAVAALASERHVLVAVAGVVEIPFRGDEDLLRQLLLNVIQNAVQHTPEGGAVEIALEQERDHVNLRVRNSGRPIRIEDQARIFDRFVQLDSSRRGEGAGLGLPIARWIARTHRGDVFLENSDASWTTFCISLPVSHRAGGLGRAAKVSPT
jgi:signal transduction histidine kinase